MPLESVTHISDLVATNPTSTDPKSEGDNHLRNIKTALKTDFPNISGPVTKTHTQLNNALDKTGDTMTGTLNVGGGGSVLVTGAGGIGYGTGSGGTVTQATSKSTAVTLNKPTGQITTSNAALGAGATVGFVLNNSVITPSDTVSVGVTSSSPNASIYRVVAQAGVGVAAVYLTNTDVVSRADTLALQFNIHKGATS